MIYRHGVVKNLIKVQHKSGIRLTKSFVVD